MGLEKGQKQIDKLEKQIQKATEINANEPEKVRVERIARAKADYEFFFHYYFPHYAKFKTAGFHVQFANALKESKTFHGIFEAFRGAAKSVHTNVGYTIWLMIQGEMKCTLLIGDSKIKACRLLAALQAELVNNQRIRQDYGEQMNRGSWRNGEFTTKAGVSFYAIGLNQSPRGTRSGAHRPDLIIVDDADTKRRCKNPMLVREAVHWITDDLLGSQDIGIERFILCNNRIGKNSILATLHRQMVEQKPVNARWYHMQINALDQHGNSSWPEKYPVLHWEQKRQMTTLRSWEHEYMNNPIEEGAVFKEDWIKWCEIAPLQNYDALVIYVDPSFKHTATSDHKAVKFWGQRGKEMHLIGAWVRKESISNMVTYLYDLYETIPQQVKVAIYMEGNFLQDIILDAFMEEGEARRYQLPIRKDGRSKPDKYSRIEAMSPMYERGFVYYNAAKRFDPDFATSIEQLLATEAGSKVADDSPDADEGAWYFLNRRARTINVRPVIGRTEERYEW